MICKTNAVAGGVGGIDTTDATATPEKILDGFTAYVNNEKIEGTIPKYTGESENAEIKTSKLASLVDGTITEVTEKDLAGVTKIKNYGLAYNNDLTSVEIPNTVTSIGETAFYYCYKLKNLTIPASVTTIGGNAFSSPPITTVNYLGTLEDWCKIQYKNSDSPFLKSGTTLYMNGELLKIAEIPNTITELKQYAFKYCNDLTSVTINDSVTIIGDGAFYNCGSLTKVIIPSSVTSIGSQALSIGSSTNKATIRMEARPNGTPPTIQSNTFNKNYLQAIEIPESEISTYSSATQWSNLTSYFVTYQP